MTLQPKNLLAFFITFLSLDFMKLINYALPCSILHLGKNSKKVQNETRKILQENKDTVVIFYQDFYFPSQKRTMYLEFCHKDSKGNLKRVCIVPCKSYLYAVFYAIHLLKNSKKYKKMVWLHLSKNPKKAMELLIKRSKNCTKSILTY